MRSERERKREKKNPRTFADLPKSKTLQLPTAEFVCRARADAMGNFNNNDKSRQYNTINEF